MAPPTRSLDPLIGGRVMAFRHRLLSVPRLVAPYYTIRWDYEQVEQVISV